MLQIKGLSQYGSYYFNMDSEEFSLYTHEQEILLYDGSKYEIINITEQIHQPTLIKFLLVELLYHY